MQSSHNYYIICIVPTALPVIEHFYVLFKYYINEYLCIFFGFRFSYLGGYYTIEQTKSRLRIIALNTNFMRHDIKYTQTHLAAVRQRPGLNIGDSSEHSNHHYHYNNHYRSNGINTNGYNSVSMAGENGGGGSGGTVSALSGGESHEAQKQWDWLENVLAKSYHSKETVSKYYCLSYHWLLICCIE